MKTLLAFFISVLSLTATAQATTYKCEDNFKLFESKYLAKEYNDAYSLLGELRKKCPKFTESLYIYGEGLLKYNIEVAATPEDQKVMINDLVALYGEQEVNYPGKGSNVKKILLQYDSKLIKADEAYKAFHASFTKNKQVFTDYNALYAYFQLFFDEYKSGKGISDDQYFERYAEILTQIFTAQDKIASEKEALLKKQETVAITDGEKQYIEDADVQLEALENVNKFISKQSNDYISCDKMEMYYTKNYENHVNDTAWLEAMVGAMYGKKCFSSATLYKGALAVYKVSTTAESAYRMAILSQKKKDIAEAVKYFDEAATLETNPLKKSTIYYDIAMFMKANDKAVAKKYALLSAEGNPKSGRAYVLLSGLYGNILPGSKECNMTDFERKTLNYIAIDYAKKAQVAEPRLKGTTDAMIAQYTKQLPTKAEAKALDKKKGDTVTYGCWVNQTVTLPNL